MTCFDKSPMGCEVVERSYINEVEEQTQIVRDIRDLTERNDVKAGSIIILMNKPKDVSCLKDTKKIGKYDLVSLGFDHDESINQIRYSNISVFKGLEADVVLIIDIDERSGEKLAQMFYVQGSRAKSLLYIYKSAVET